MSRPSALKPLDPDQAAAADPFIHAALSASAGTGKTQVLTARVLRLLLENASPESILCLTFTKAAAAEMAERIGGRLAFWVGLDDAALDRELGALGVASDPALRSRARRLFATVLDCPGGLRIQTIHSFCQTLLAAFPAEAGISPGFRAIEGREEEALVERTLAALAERSAGGDGAFLADLEVLASRLGEADVRKYLRRCAGSVEGMARFDRLEDVEPQLRDMMGLPGNGVEELVAARCHDDEFDCDTLQGLADAYRRWGTKTAEAVIPEIEGWLALDSGERCRNLHRFAHATVLTGSGSRRSVKNLLKHWPEAQEACDALCEKIEELLALLRGDALVRLLAAGLRAGKRFADAFAVAKRAEGVADFDDLIRWSRDLLAQDGIAEWIRFKLDRRTDHLLVDEAQDTNESQWAIVKAMTGEYFAGAGAGPEHRTLFMVGDFKQAIYGFQGTDPAEFEKARNYFREAAEGGPIPFRSLSISRSFRSAQAVLDVADMVLSHLTPTRIGLPDAPLPHLSFHTGRPGSVEVWPPYEHDAPDDDEGEEKWEDEARRKYASHLADWIKAEIERAPVLVSTGRPLGPGDILVLVRSRANLAPLLVARLFERNVPTAGLDRLILSEPLAVQDLLAAMRFAVQPLDDLTLANLLVSPLIGWSQEQLYDLAGRERRRPLWEELGHRSDERDDFRSARASLNELLGMAGYAGPHAFLERILSGPMGGRRKLFARLGRQARDPINELISAALQFEGGEPVTLQQFLAWLSHGTMEVKRDPEGRQDSVRIMTVHGAKGLEAPLVILADATANPSELGGNSPILDVPSATGRFPIIRPRRDEVAPPFDQVIAAEKDRDLEEHFRLLYVALTRAGERLIVSGLKPTRKISTDSWHHVVSEALKGAGIEPDARGVLHHAAGQQQAAAQAEEAAAIVPKLSIPAWARAAAPAEARPPRPLAPSQVAADTDSRPPPTPELAAAAERGRLLHALFERLPATPPADRRRGAFAWLQQSAGVTEAALRTALVESALSIIEAPEHAQLFSPAALAEAPIAATLPDGTVVAGTVDRLLVSEGCVRVVDFKTGRQVPRDAGAIPASHLRQMRAYGRALQVIFPRHRIELALLYTEAPLMLSVQLEDLPTATHMA
nr:double-strand break repair helicase AddA [uncultured Sphingomonas sp.]